jgi:hypothetical protein
MIDREDLVPVDDPRVTEYRRWLRAADQWRLTQAERNDKEAVYDEAGKLIARFRDTTTATPLRELANYRMATEWEKTVVNREWSESAANERRTLLAMARGLLDFGPVAFGPFAISLAADLTMRANGSPPLMGSKIPLTNRYGWNPWVMDIAKAQTILLAHYNAGLERSTWLTEHGKIYPRLGEDMRKVWNALVDGPTRKACKRVGILVRRKTPLTPDDAVIQLRATLYEAAVLREWISGNPD